MITFFLLLVIYILQAVVVAKYGADKTGGNIHGLFWLSIFVTPILALLAFLMMDRPTGDKGDTAKRAEPIPPGLFDVDGYDDDEEDDDEDEDDDDIYPRERKRNVYRSGFEPLDAVLAVLG